MNDTKKRKSEIQRQEMNLTANDNGNENICPLKKTTSQIEEQLVRDYITNEIYMPLSSTIDCPETEEREVVIKSLRGPVIGLHFMRHNSVVIDTTHGLIPFLHLAL